MAGGIKEKFLIPPLVRLHGVAENKWSLHEIKGYYMYKKEKSFSAQDAVNL